MNCEDFRSKAGQVTAAAMPAREVYPIPCPTAYPTAASGANDVMASPSSISRACSHPTTCCSPLGRGHDSASLAAAAADDFFSSRSFFSGPASFESVEASAASSFFRPSIGVCALPTKGTMEATP